MLRFMMLLCLCLFPFSGAWCEKQAAAEAPGASALAIWGGNGDESLSSAYRTSEGDVVLLAQTDSTSGTPALSSRTADGTRDGWILRVSGTGDLKSETLLSWEGEPFILGAAENPEGLCMIVVESIDKTEYVENTGYIVKYNVSSKAIQREKLPGLPHDVYACERGLLITGACAVDASHAAAWSAFVDASGRISWGYCSPEMYSENEIVFQKGVLRQNETILYCRKPDEPPEKQYLRISPRSSAAGTGAFQHSRHAADGRRAFDLRLQMGERRMCLNGFCSCRSRGACALFQDVCGYAKRFIRVPRLTGRILFCGKCRR